MKFSVMLPRPRPDGAGATLAECVEVAQAVERVGLHAVSASDHPFPVYGAGDPGHQAHDAFVLLTYVGAQTRRIALHFSVIVAAYRNPFVVARSLSTMSLAFPGRLIAGLGAGYLEGEFTALGADFGVRGKAVGQAVEAFRAAWNGRPVVMSGNGWQACGNRMQPVPDALTIWRGGNSQGSLRDALTRFDGWTPFEADERISGGTRTDAMTLSVLAERTKHIDEMMERDGRSLPLDVCFVRPSRRWLANPSTVERDLARMADARVTWLEFNPTGSSAPELIDGIGRFAELARKAGALTK